ncbi:hypothetical protein [Gordonia zhaorongruii]|uniref:hypothetical protein n=1 Tax=Gordonia zhaorongruii TaxID=2597659 RepID=UPI00117E7522|nr:hypothetical protein [Gordonia zhaorongruii]
MTNSSSVPVVLPTKGSALSTAMIRTEHLHLMREMYGLTPWTGYEPACKCPRWTVKPCRRTIRGLTCFTRRDWGVACDHPRRWQDADGNRVLTWEPYIGTDAALRSIESSAAIGEALASGVEVIVCTGSPYVTAVDRLHDTEAPVSDCAVVIFRGGAA